MAEKIASNIAIRADSAIGLVARLCNIPMLIQSAELDKMLGIAGRIAGMTVSADPAKPPEQLAVRPQIIHQLSGGVAVIPVRGVLTQEYDWFTDYLFGCTTYGDIRDQFRQALNDPAVTAIVFDIASPGGEVAGCFDLVDEIYEARGMKPVYAIANEFAYSAAYAIASSAEKIYLPRTGGVGSVGVICIHIDQSQWDEQMGLKYTAIFAGDRKNDFTPHEPLSDEARTIAQQNINETYDLFAQTVARNRGMSAAAVKATQAALYEGKKGVDAGLADAVMSSDKARAEIIKKSNSKGGNKKMKFWEKLKAFFQGLQTGNLSESETQELAGKLKTAVADVPAEEVQAIFGTLGYVPKPAEGAAATPPDLEKVRAETKASTLHAVQSILDICALGGMDMKMASSLITEGATPDEARTKVLEAKAAAAGRTHIRSTVGALSTGEVNPLLAEAQKRADAAAQKRK
jgi:signal peptide peptidase SppA